jgi:hypothetical protein
VVLTIQDWDSSVNNVNTFLNNAATTTTVTPRDAQNALDFANNEPEFLTTLMNVPGLSIAGQDAAANLGQIFPIVPTSLQKVVSGGSAVDAANAINAARCPTGGILDDIRTLWIAAAAAVAADTPGGTLGPFACLRGPTGSDAYN